jgi:hypothetical protein
MPTEALYKTSDSTRNPGPKPEICPCLAIQPVVQVRTELTLSSLWERKQWDGRHLQRRSRCRRRESSPTAGRFATKSKPYVKIFGSSCDSPTTTLFEARTATAFCDFILRIYTGSRTYLSKMRQHNSLHSNSSELTLPETNLPCPPGSSWLPASDMLLSEQGCGLVEVLYSPVRFCLTNTSLFLSSDMSSLLSDACVPTIFDRPYLLLPCLEGGAFCLEHKSGMFPILVLS